MVSDDAILCSSTFIHTILIKHVVLFDFYLHTFSHLPTLSSTRETQTVGKTTIRFSFSDLFSLVWLVFFFFFFVFCFLFFLIQLCLLWKINKILKKVDLKTCGGLKMLGP
jgi:hypothetical protein